MIDLARYLARIPGNLPGLVCLFLLALQVEAASPPRHVQVSLVSSVDQVAPGDSFRVLFRQQIDEGWHTYWTNPGDSGAPPEIQWELPPGVTAGDFSWPYPERIPFGPLMNFGYHGTVLLPFTVNVPANFRGDELNIAGAGRVLVCADICIPQKVNVALQLPVAETTIVAADQAALFARADALLPVTLDLPATVRLEPGRLLLNPGLPVPDDHRITGLAFFPDQPEVIDHMADQIFEVTAEGIELTLLPGLDTALLEDRLAGVLVMTENAGSADNPSQVVTGYTINAKMPGSPAPGPAAAGLSLPLAMLLAFLGGVILNLMPCVFPVLSIKVLSLVNHHERAAVHGLVYAAGVVLSFIVVALLLVLLRSSGEVIGWGFQLQSPLVVGALVYLFLAIALNLLGVFEIGTGLMQFGSAGTGQGGYAGSFSTGVLATVVAAPCTAPFMGAAVGFALTQSLMTTVLVFAALGVGMALPLLLLSLSPGLVRRMPRPGRWMEILRQLLAFPMLASMIWLAWVLGVQVGATGMMQILAGALALGFALWSNAVFTTPAVRWPLVLTAIAVSGYLLVSLPSVQQEVSTTVTREGGFPAGSYSVEALAEARQLGPVLKNYRQSFILDWIM